MDPGQQLPRLDLRVVAVLQDHDPLDWGVRETLPDQLVELLCQACQRFRFHCRLRVSLEISVTGVTRIGDLRKTGSTRVPAPTVRPTARQPGAARTRPPAGRA